MIPRLLPERLTEVIAFICGAIALLLMILALASTHWLLAQGWRQGLFKHCVDDEAEQPLPFGLTAEVGCHSARDKSYIQACAAFCVITFLLDAAATVLTGAGLSLKDPGKKYLFYKIAVYVMIAALVCVLISLVVYPVCFAGELEYGNRTKWEFGWAYGVAWGAAIFLFGGIVLLLCDKESEEIYYKERTIVHGEGDAKA